MTTMLAGKYRHLSQWTEFDRIIPEYLDGKKVKASPFERRHLWAYWILWCEKYGYDCHAFDDLEKRFVNPANLYPLSHPYHPSSDRVAILVLLGRL